MSAGAKDPIRTLIGELSRLPGIGEKTASRLTFYLLTQPPELALSVSSALRSVVERIRPCAICCNLSEQDPCPICADSHRDPRQVCVVEGVTDLASVDQLGSYRGVYHVLHGTLSPLDGVGPDDIRLTELERRLGSGDIEELIIATNPTAEGEATAAAIARLPRSAGVRLTRLATGLPMGGDLEYTDKMTLARALDNRHEIDG